MTGPDSEGLQAEAVERVKVARKALTERHATALAAASPIHWWDEKLLRELLVQAACPIMCVGYRQPGGTDWHEWCERKADAAMAALAGVLPPSSPVVPSVGAVPVEVPDGCYSSDADQAMFRRAFKEAGLAPTLAAWKSAALIAARVRAEADAAALERVGRVLDVVVAGNSRRTMATQQLVERIAADINAALQADDALTEHDAQVRAEDGGAESKAWHKRRLIEFAQAVDSRVGSVHLTNTLNESERVWLARAAVGLAREVLDGDCAAPNEWVEVVRAEERQQIAPMLLELHRIMEDAIVRGGYREGEAEQVERLMDSLAAGSAVPVTPDDSRFTNHAGAGHEFTFTVEMRGEGCNWSSTLVPVTVRAYNLRDAILQAAAVPFAQWFPAEEDTEQHPAPPVATPPSGSAQAFCGTQPGHPPHGNCGGYPPSVATPTEPTRFVLVDHREDGGGRLFDADNLHVRLAYQDDGRTLKVFVTPPAEQDGQR